MRVRAKAGNSDKQVMGYYGLKRIRSGEEFVLSDEKHFSSKWMEKIDSGESEAKAKVKPGKKHGAKPGKKHGAPTSIGDEQIESNEGERA